VTFSAGCCGCLFFFVCTFVCMVYIHLLCKLYGCQDHECAESLTRKVVISYVFVYKSEIIAPPSKLLSRECFAYLCGFNIMMLGPSQAHRQTIARPALKGMDVMLNHGMTLATRSLCIQVIHHFITYLFLSAIFNPLCSQSGDIVPSYLTYITRITSKARTRCEPCDYESNRICPS